MQTTTVTTAAREYARRPKDEQIPTIADMIATAQADRDHCVERQYNWKDLEATYADARVLLASPKGAAPLSHWAFGQMARSLGAPASYLRELPPALAAQCLNFGISETPVGQTAKILARRANGQPPLIRAITSDTYTRVWDGDLYDRVNRDILQYKTPNGEWQNAPTWAGESIAGYRSDRDSFLFQVDGGSIVNDPSVGREGDGRLFRGIMIRNSEVGASSITIEVVLFRYVCGNHMLWGATIARAFKRRHVGQGITREVMREIARLSREFTDRPASADEALIKALIAHEIATTRDAVIDELRAVGLSASQAADAYARAEQTENASPRSYWGIAQGITRISQDSGYQDERYALDKLAGVVLARGAKRVAA